MKKKNLTLELKLRDSKYLKEPRGGFKEPLFAFTTPVRAGHIKAVTTLTYCRESFCEYIRQQLRNVTDYGINLNKLHLVVYRRVVQTPSKLPNNLNIFKDQVLAGQVMVNAIEKKYGWPFTRVYPVKVSGVPANSAFYYVAASKRWMKAPAMLSLFTLLFRIAANNGKFKFHQRIKDIKTFYSVLEDASLKSGQEELTYYGEHGSLWPLVFDNYRKLFGERSMTDLYFPGKDGYYFSEGINTLCDTDTRDHKLRRQFGKIIEKNRSHLY